MKSAPVGELISSYLWARPLALSGKIIHNNSYPFSFCLVHGIHTAQRTSFLSPLIKHHLEGPCLLGQSAEMRFLPPPPRAIFAVGRSGTPGAAVHQGNLKMEWRRRRREPIFVSSEGESGSCGSRGRGRRRTTCSYGFRGSNSRQFHTHECVCVYMCIIHCIHAYDCKYMHVGVFTYI